MICINKKCGVELPDDAIYCLYCGRKQIREPKQKLRGNGEGTVFKRGETWTAEVVIGWKKDKDGVRHRVRRTKGGFRTKKEALEYVPTLKKTPSKKAVTLSALYDGWSESAMLKLSRSKQTSYKIAYDKIEDIAYINIGALTIKDLQDCVNEHAPTFYTAKDIRTLLSHLYDRACAQGEVQTNLARYIELPELEEVETTPFSAEEQKTLWEDYNAGNKFTGYLLLMIYTGMMPGELLQAKKSMIDWDARQITGCGLKTKKRKETPILLPDIILPVLEALCEGEKDKLLPYRRDDFYDEFKKTIARLGLNPELRPYSCRHTTATALDEADLPPTIIKEIMRHTKFSTTERYIHKDTSVMLEAVNEKLKKPD
ncbi:MAG: tyrosine-type recombinase/integrase [Oscillospiraceae bacterium]